jgi:hypothetical protein
MDNWLQKQQSGMKRRLFSDGSDMSLEMLEGSNALDSRVQPRLLDRLMDEPKPFHETIMPDRMRGMMVPVPGQQPLQILAPPLPAPARPQLQSVLKR